jgi:hypothetical protein
MLPLCKVRKEQLVHKEPQVHLALPEQLDHKALLGQLAAVAHKVPQAQPEQPARQGQLDLLVQLDPQAQPEQLAQQVLPDHKALQVPQAIRAHKVLPALQVLPAHKALQVQQD